MKYLVTGGAGFIGSNLIEKLLGDDHEVICIDNYSTGKKENEIDGCAYYDVDLLKWGKSMTFLPKLDVIFHLAAEVASIDYSYKEPYKTLNTNIDGTMRVCEYARRNKIKVVFASSCAVTDGDDLNIYAYSKSKAEDICKAYNHFFGLSVAIVRFANVYGKKQRNEGPYRSVISIFDECYRNNTSLPIRGDGQQTRDFIDVRDICDGLIKISKLHSDANIFRLGTGSSISINEVAKIYNLPIHHVSERSGESKGSYTDLSKNLFNFKTKYTIKDWVDNLK
jgi:UDP-glucose 4-epimerase